MVALERSPRGAITGRWDLAAGDNCLGRDPFALSRDRLEHLGPRRGERLSALPLQPLGERGDVDAGGLELGQRRPRPFAPSAAIGDPTSPWSAKASSVFSGIVLTVSGDARAST